MATKTTTKPKTKPESVATDTAKAPGVIDSIAEFLTKATKTKPITKDQVLAKLVTRFPERSEASMKTTVSLSVPGYLTKKKGLTIQANDKTPRGYWIQTR